MYVRKDISFKIIWFFSRTPLILFTALAVSAYCSYVFLGWKFVAIPFLPVATIGTAVAFYVGFKNNASYERLWEARKIWAEIAHLCRFWAMMLTQTYVLDANGNEQNLLVARRLVYRQIAWAYCLSVELRSEYAFEKLCSERISQVQVVAHHKANQGAGLQEILETFTCSHEAIEILESNNMSATLLAKQINDLNHLRRAGISSDEYSKLCDVIQACSQQQSAAERINRFPFPRQYAYFSSLFVNIFILLLPFSLLNELAKNDSIMLWTVVPMSILTSWVFYTMEKVGDTSENPFENGLNDVPMTSICRDIEIDLKAMLRENSLPDRLGAKEGILM